MSEEDGDDAILQITTHYNKVILRTYDICNISLNTVTEHEHLGICLHCKLSWSPHVDRVRNKTNCLLGFLKQNLYNALNNLDIQDIDKI